MKRMKRGMITLAMGAVLSWASMVDDVRAAGLSCEVVREHVDAIYPKELQLWKSPLTYRVDYHYTDTPLTNIDRTVKAYVYLFSAYSGIDVVEQPPNRDQTKFQVIVTSDFAQTFDLIRPRYEAMFEQGETGAYQKLIERVANGEGSGHIMLFVNEKEIAHVLVLINPEVPPEGFVDAAIITHVVRGLMGSANNSNAYGPSVFNTGIVKDVFYPLPPADLELMETMYVPNVTDNEMLKEKLCQKHRKR